MFVVTFNPRPITGPGSVDQLRQMSLQEARELVAYAASIPKHGRIVNVETLEVVES